MSRAAQSIFYFSWYLMFVGLGLLLFPAFFEVLLGIGPRDFGFIRLIGMMAAAIGVYYYYIAVYNHDPLLRLTVYTRTAIAITITLLVLFDQVPDTFLLLAVIDLAGALWTRFSLATAR